MIPSVEQMNNPQIILEVKRKNSVVRKLLLDVLGDKLRTNIISPIKKKKELPKFVSPSASDVTPMSQNESPVQAVQNQGQRCIAETLNYQYLCCARLVPSSKGSGARSILHLLTLTYLV